MRIARLAIAPVKGLGLVHPQEALLRPDRGTERPPLLPRRSGRTARQQQGLRRADAGAAGRLPTTQIASRSPFPPATRSRARSFSAPPSRQASTGARSPAATSRARGRTPSPSTRAGRSASCATDEPGAAIDRAARRVADLGRLARGARAHGPGSTRVDGRRFRMTIELEGCAEHEEDGWIGGEVGVGEARIRRHRPGRQMRRDHAQPGHGRVGPRHARAVLGGYRTLREGRSFGCGVCGDVLAEGTDPRRRLPRARALTRGIAPPSARADPSTLTARRAERREEVTSRCVRHSTNVVGRHAASSFRSVFHSDKARGS